MADFDELTERQPKSVIRRNVGPVNGKNMDALNKLGSRSDSKPVTTSQYCEKLQEWMWQYYCGYVNWQSWMTVFPPCLPPQTTTESPGATTWGVDFPNTDLRNWFGHSFALTHSYSLSSHNDVGTTPTSNANQREVNGNGQNQTTLVPPQVQQNGNAQQPGREYLIPPLFHRFLAEIVDFFILFFIKATIILSIIQFSGMKDLSKFAMHFIVEEIDDDTSMEELQKMMAVALVYRILVCFYEIICIWGAGGATPGKFLLGLRVVTCNTSILVQPNRVCVVPASNVSLSASAIRALNKNFSIAFFFPAFITLLFFQHNRTVYDIVAGTIVVKRNRLR